MHLNLDDTELKQYIYRTISYDRLIELFSTRKNTLVKPSLWEDTFENFVLKSTLKDEAGRQIKYDIHNRIYGQCWTLENSSDAMWRIYSSQKDGVRIRTTIDKLLDSLCIATIDRKNCEHCIGKVEYLREAELVKRAKDSFTQHGEITFGKLFNSLLLKRRAFRHENEIRLMFCDWSEGAGNIELFKYDIEPHNFITQIMIDPRVPHEAFKIIEHNIRQQTAFQGEIKRSLLYRLPENLTFEIQAKKTSSK
ncbi:DUF2971 domain-containing protein [Pseudomonas sp. GM25]|uniref:DUF2971 domain-containing protein n=1 Tax=Pseudomonas sp. GM25 TaxID=1144327 RepID=UPI0002705868|nr:DUF2971 domain-containing protein [Pseudomonas sp. GM25]EJM23335.1 Protein of unknown function (DUF2971) [Pseudomonas sp. GM25]